MDEYVLVPRTEANQAGSGRVAKVTFEGRQPPDSNDALTLGSLVAKIIGKKDMNDYEKADLLAAALQRYQAWSSQESTQRSEKIISVDQLVPEPVNNVTMHLKPVKKHQPPVTLSNPLKRSLPDEGTQDADKKERPATVKSFRKRPSLKKPAVRAATKPYYISDDMEVETGETKRKRASPYSGRDGPNKRRLKLLKRNLDKDESNNKRRKWITI